MEYNEYIKQVKTSVTVLDIIVDLGIARVVSRRTTPGWLLTLKQPRYGVNKRLRILHQPSTELGANT